MVAFPEVQQIIHPQTLVRREPPAPHSPPPRPLPVVVRPTPPVPATTTPTVVRTTVAAARTPPTPAQVTAAAWQPWAQNVTAAQGQFRTEIQSALRDLREREDLASKILDTAEQDAAAFTTPLIASAYARLQRDLDAAARTADDILGPARAAYDSAIAAAHAAYDKQLTQAEVVYRGRVADADRAKADAQNIAQAG